MNSDSTEMPQPLEEETAALYPGDLGALPLETRRVLVQLLMGPCIDGRRHSNLWPVLARDEDILRARLADLFLDLVIDHDQQVAFTRQAAVGELESPTILRRSPLTFIDSVLLLALRQALARADAHGERAIVNSGELAEQLRVYEQAANTDHAGFSKRIQTSIEKMKKNSILFKLRGSDDRFEVSPTLKLLFSAEEIQGLTAQYQALLNADGTRVATEEAADEDDE